ncbi:phosphoribosylanthranilate isomerase [Halococcus thailandensis]|uniref:N-(5'-phosphoribosyl)anthranilate isomerase n=1 Tax=Halococcus thailandensis JCM 13552 TaxID=1227457 RepID=M0N0V8_9EURY|nr:phosphoribosylanthranilate isomerase [Halococcus thailandensis]EMA51188.1 phosphoribosylanthranilate isomerase [Halococcus thailandensis JCM 13552]
MTRTKLCGLTRERDLDAAIDAGADMVGVVSRVPIETPRELAPDRAAALVDRIPDSVTSVLVTMPETPDEGAALVERVAPDAIQVHGCSPAEIEELSERIAVPVIAGVDAVDDDLDDYATVTDALVLDSTDEQGAGGTGETHDWARARKIVADLDAPVLLAGGLTPENVASAVETVAPFGVDVSSGIEDQQGTGTKDHAKLQRFVARVSGEPLRA